MRLALLAAMALAVTARSTVRLTSKEKGAVRQQPNSRLRAAVTRTNHVRVVNRFEPEALQQGDEELSGGTTSSPSSPTITTDSSPVDPTTFGDVSPSTSGGGGGGGVVTCPSQNNGTFCAFAVELLTELQLPVTQNNLIVFVSWFKALRNTTCAYNPLISHNRMPGSGFCTTSGAQSYLSWQDGIQASVTMLQAGVFGSVLADLKQSLHPASTAYVISTMPIDAGGQAVLERTLNGQYVAYYQEWAELPIPIPANATARL